MRLREIFKVADEEWESRHIKSGLSSGEGLINEVRELVEKEGENEERFPGCWAYLNARRAELEKRNITGGAAEEQQWYQFGRSQSLVKFNTAKIILPALSFDRLVGNWLQRLPRQRFSATGITEYWPAASPDQYAFAPENLTAAPTGAALSVDTPARKGR